MQAHLRSTHWIQTPRGRGEWNLNQEMMWPEMDKGLLPQTLGSTEIQRMGGTCFLIIPLSSHTQSTRIMPGHSSTPILHHYQARFLWRISTHVHTYVHTPSFLDTHRQTTKFEKPELFGQKLIDRILLLFVPADSCWSHKRWQGTDFVCEWEHLCARACVPTIVLVRVTLQQPFAVDLVWLFSHHLPNAPGVITRVTYRMYACAVFLFVSVCISLHVLQMLFISCYSFPQVTRDGCVPFFFLFINCWQSYIQIPWTSGCYLAP